MTHSHHHHAPPDKANLAFALSVSLNLIYTIVQALYAISANSMSLLADAGHNLGDVLGLLLAWGASWLLTRPTSERFSYGYKRTSILAALLNAAILVGASCLIAYESIHKFFDPENVAALTVIVVALVGIIINAGTALLFFKDRHSDLNIKGAFLHLASDALVSLGVVIGAAVIYYTNLHWIDPLIGLLIVGTILYSTWGLLIDSVNLMMDAVPRQIDQQEVKDLLSSHKGVKAIHDLHIWGLSSKEIALTAHLIVPDQSFTDEDLLRLSNALKQSFKIGHVTLQVERGENQFPCKHLKSC